MLKGLPLPLPSRLSHQQFLLLATIAASSVGDDGKKFAPVTINDLLEGADYGRNNMGATLKTIEKQGLIVRSNRSCLSLNQDNYKSFVGKSPPLFVSRTVALRIWDERGLTERQKILALLYHSEEKFAPYDDALRQIGRSASAYTQKAYKTDCAVVLGFFGTENGNLDAKNGNFAASDEVWDEEKEDIDAGSNFFHTENSDADTQNSISQNCSDFSRAENGNNSTENGISCLPLAENFASDSPNSLINNLKIKTTKKTTDGFLLEDSVKDGVLFLQIIYKEKFKVLPEIQEIWKIRTSIYNKIEEGFTVSALGSVMREAWERYRQGGDIPAFSLKTAKYGFQKFKARVLNPLIKKGYSPSEIRWILRDLTDPKQLEGFSARVASGQIRDARSYAHHLTPPASPRNSTKDSTKGSTKNSTNTSTDTSMHTFSNGTDTRSESGEVVSPSEDKSALLYSKNVVEAAQKHFTFQNRMLEANDIRKHGACSIFMIAYMEETAEEPPTQQERKSATT